MIRPSYLLMACDSTSSARVTLPLLVTLDLLLSNAVFDAYLHHPE